MKHNRYSESDGVLYVLVEGELAFEEVLDHYQQLIDNEYPAKNLRILIDLRKAELQFNPFDIENVKPKFFESLTYYSSLKEAYVTSNPEQTVPTMIFEFMADSLPDFEAKVFSSMDVAKSWLKIK